MVVTILDPYTFDSDWVRLENAVAAEHGIPIIGLYDGDRFRASVQIRSWVKLPSPATLPRLTGHHHPYPSFDSRCL